MKKQVATLLLLFFTIVVFGQNNYDRGFKNGYKEGYCYNDVSCVAPIPPITPIPLIGEGSESYQDGYNRGFKTGLEDKQAKKTNSGGYQPNSGGRQQGGQGPYLPKYSTIDYGVLMKALEMRQAQYEQNEQMKKEKAVGLMNQVKAFYNSLTTFPEEISDGWHKVISTNNYDFCAERKVYVSNNKVTKYVIDDWMEKSISYPTKINNAKAMVQLVNDDGTTGDMVELYFLEFLNNPSSNTSPPSGSGKISFWTNWKNAGSMELYFDGMYIGKFSSYFDNGSPSCGQQGTLTITYKPGTYSYKAVSSGGWSTKTWDGTVTIYAGGCQLQGLTK